MVVLTKVTILVPIWRNISRIYELYNHLTDVTYSWTSRAKTTGEYNYPAPHPLADNKDTNWKASVAKLGFFVHESAFVSLDDAFTWLIASGLQSRVYSLYLHTPDGKVTFAYTLVYGARNTPDYAIGWRPKTIMALNALQSEYETKHVAKPAVAKVMTKHELREKRSKEAELAEIDRLTRQLARPKKPAS